MIELFSPEPIQQTGLHCAMEGSWRNDQRGVVGNGYYSPDSSATSIPASPLLSTLPSLLSGSPHQASM